MTINPKERLFRDCVKNVERRWGKYVRALVGDEIYRALLSEEVMILCCAQDDAVHADSIVEIMRHCNSRIIDTTILPDPWEEAEIAP